MMNSLSVSAIKNVGKEHYNDVIVSAMALQIIPHPCKLPPNHIKASPHWSVNEVSFLTGKLRIYL